MRKKKSFNKNGYASSSVLIICVTLIILAGGFIWYQKNLNDTRSEINNDGTYVLTASVTESNKCAPASGTVMVNDEVLSGSLTTTRGVVASISATVDKKGKITTGATTNGVIFNGKVSNGSGEGTWSDVYGCSGTFVIKKIGDGIQVNVNQPDAAINVKVNTQSQSVPVNVPIRTNAVNTNVNTGVSAQTQTNNDSSVTVTGSAGGVSTSVTYTGDWSGRATDTSGGICQNYSLTGTVQNGILSGIARGEFLGDISGFKAGISQSGVISGIAGELVQFNGKISTDGRSASGSYYFVASSGSNCKGSFYFTKK